MPFVFALRIVEKPDAVKHVAPSFLAGFVCLAPDAFAFQQLEKSFRLTRCPDTFRDGASRGPDCAPQGIAATQCWWAVSLTGMHVGFDLWFAPPDGYPMTPRENRSITTARYRSPASVRMYVMSLTRNRPGASTSNSWFGVLSAQSAGLRAHSQPGLLCPPDVPDARLGKG
jgi:hypothetical protein